MVLFEGFIPGQALYGSDIYLQFHAWRHYGFTELARGTVPLWNPYIFCGVPYIAGMQSAIFYPLNAIFLFLPTAQAIDVSLTLHLAVAGFFMYAWLRRLKLGFSPAVTGAVVFAFSGFPLTHIFGGHLPHLNTWAWLPAVFLAVDHLVSARNLRSSALLGLVLAVQATAGHPQFLFLTLLAAFAYGAARTARLTRGNGRLRVAGMGLLALPIAFCLAAVQLVPFLEFLPHANRSLAASPTGFATMASLPPENLATLFIPGLFGLHDLVPGLDPLARPELLERVYWGRWIYWELCPFVGIIPLLLAMMSPSRARRFHALFFIILSAAALALALGRYNPLYPALMKAVPILGGLRTPGRFLCLSAFGLATLAGMGCEALLHDRGRLRARARAASIAAAGVALAVTIVLASARAPGGSVQARWEKFVTRKIALGERWGRLPPPSDPEFQRLSLEGALRGTVQLAAALAVGSVLLLAGTASQGIPSRRRILALLIPAAVFAELWTFGKDFVHTVDEAQLRWEEGLVDFLRQEPQPVRLLTLTGTASLNRGMLHHISNAAGSDSAILANYSRLANLNEGAPVDTPLSIVRLRRPTPVLEFMGITHVLVSRGRTPPLEGFELAFEGEAADLYKDSSPAPFAFTVHDWKTIRDSGEAARELASGRIDTLRTVILDSPAPAGFLPRPDLAGRKAQVRNFSPGHIVVDAELEANGFLVVREAMYPGWNARSWSEAAGWSRPEILFAGTLFKAVPLPAGAHRVELAYQPASFRAGGWISLASCAGLCMMWAFEARRRRCTWEKR